MTDVNNSGRRGVAEQVSEATLTAQNTFTAWARWFGEFNLLIAGTLVASTVTVQRSFDGGTTIYDVPSADNGVFTAVAQATCHELEPDVYWRVGIKTGDYGGADSVYVRLSK